MTTNLDPMLAQLPSEKVNGWRWAWEYPGFLAWYHEEMPNGFLAATPFWGSDDAIALEWQTIDGDVYSLPDIPFTLTDDPAKDAAAYVAALLPVFTHCMRTFI